MQNFNLAKLQLAKREKINSNEILFFVQGTLLIYLFLQHWIKKLSFAEGRSQTNTQYVLSGKIFVFTFIEDLYL